MEVVALKQGFDGLKVREEGEKFEMPDGAEATWFRAIEVKKVKAPKAEQVETKASAVNDLA